MKNQKTFGLIAFVSVAVYVATTTGWFATCGLFPHAVAASPHGDDGSRVNAVGRPVRVVSFSFRERPIDEIVHLVDQEGAAGADLIVLPEAWAGKEPLPLDCPLMQQLESIAKKHRTYIVNSMFRRNGSRAFNSAVLIDREGAIAGIYDKAFPFWAELETNADLDVGADAPVFDTDFGKLGVAICFDVNFPEFWRRLADRNAELVVWPSAYSAGSALQAHAINHHYYIVTSTWHSHCLVYDITGELLVNSKRNGVNITRVSLDLDRRVYHENYNWSKAQKILKDLPDDVALDRFLDFEQWFVLRANRPGVNILSIAEKYGLEDHRDFIKRSRMEMDRRRGRTLDQPIEKDAKADGQQATATAPAIRNANVSVPSSAPTAQ
jgi:predicted amidohydrolase